MVTKWQGSKERTVETKGEREKVVLGKAQRLMGKLQVTESVCSALW